MLWPLWCRQVGITATITSEDWGIYLPKVLASEFATTILGTEQGRLVADPEQRREIYLQAQARIFELAPHAFLFHSAQYEALQSYVEGFEHFQNTSYLGLRTTWLGR